jgi:hypothetical protein
MGHLGWRTALVWIGIAAIILAVVDIAYLYTAVGARTDEYRARAELLTWAFADRVSFDLAQGNSQDLEFLAGTIVLGNVLYAQVVSEGTVLAEVNRLSRPLSAAIAPEGVLEIDRRTSEYGVYWDIRRALPDADGYVRLGLSLEPLENAIRAQALLILGISLALLALVGAAALLYARYRSPHPSPEAVPGEGGLTTSPIATSAVEQVRRIGVLLIDEGSKRVRVRGEPVELSPKEYQVLTLLAGEPGRVFSSDEILRHVWSDNHLASAQDVKQYIYFLRQKLEVDPRKPQLIVTVRGFGYKLQP